MQPKDEPNPKQNQSTTLLKSVGKKDHSKISHDHNSVKVKRSACIDHSNIRIIKIYLKL